MAHTPTARRGPELRVKSFVHGGGGGASLVRGAGRRTAPERCGHLEGGVTR